SRNEPKSLMFGVDFLRRAVTHCRMQTFAIVPEFDVLPNILPRNLTREVTHPRDTFVLQGAKERLGPGTVEGGPRRPRRLPESEAPEDVGILGGHVVAAPIRVEYRSLHKLSVPGRVADGLGYQRGLIVVIHRVTDDFLGAAVNNG